MFVQLRRCATSTLCNFNVAQLRFVAVLCLLGKIKCNSMHPLDGALPGLYVPVRDNYRQCFCRTSACLCASSQQNIAGQQDFNSPLLISVERSCCPFIRWCWPGGFQALGHCLFISQVARSLLSSTVFSFYSFFSRVAIWGCCIRTDRVLITLS